MHSKFGVMLSRRASARLDNITALHKLVLTDVLGRWRLEGGRQELLG